MYRNFFNNHLQISGNANTNILSMKFVLISLYFTAILAYTFYTSSIQTNNIFYDLINVFELVGNIL